MPRLQFSASLPARAFRISRQPKRGNSKDPSWQVVNSFSRRQLPKQRDADLLDSGSLTQRLIRASHGNFSVNVLMQAWQRPDFTERRRLALKDNERAFIREVGLVCNGEVWVVARSVIPRRSLQGSSKRLSRLGNRPLGATLFKDPGLSRTLFEVCQLNAQHLPDFSTLLPQQSLWGRRSVFRLRGKPLLVSEIFLPECPELHSAD